MKNSADSLILKNSTQMHFMGCNSCSDCTVFKRYANFRQSTSDGIFKPIKIAVIADDHNTFVYHFNIAFRDISWQSL